MIALSTPLSLVSFISVDVETTGLDPASDAIVEMGAVKVQDNRVVDEWSTLVWTDRTIPWVARQVHGIGNDMLVGQPSLPEAMADLRAFAGEGILVEHSHKAFDVLFLERAHGGPLDMPYLNTCTLSRRLFPHIPKHSLAECCRRFSIVNRQPHRARGDARATADLLIRLLELSATRYPSLGDLMTVAAVERGGVSAGRPRSRRRTSSRRS
jgi:DNA polymerase III epsilon subunit family exonuclease